MKSTIYLSYVMVGVLLLIAVACLAAPAAEEWLPGNRRYVMAAIMIVYSGIRFYRIQKFKKSLSSHEE